MKIASNAFNVLKPLLGWALALLAFNQLIQCQLGDQLLRFLFNSSSNSSVFHFLGQHNSAQHNASHRWTLLAIDGNSAEAHMTTGEIIKRRGYGLEIHQVVTEDGYILQMKRIRGSEKCQQMAKKNKSRPKPVFLQHGMMSGDHVYLVNSNDNALAYILADRCYDVWLGNSRGSTYSRRHVTLSPEDEPYWEYSWDEMGRYDIPANIDYILETTGEEKLIYVGHSLGCTLFYIAMIEHPHLNDKIENMISLAPTTSVASLNNYLRYMAPILTPMELFLRWTGTRAYYDYQSTTHQALTYLARNYRMASVVCGLLLFNIYGHSTTYDQTAIDTLVGHYPSGGSVKTIVHFLQNYNSGDSFHRYDFGQSGNVQRYGTAEPPQYNLSLVQAPVNIFWAENDPLVSPKDVAWLASRLGNVKTSFRVADATFSHGDFIWSTAANQLVYDHVLALIASPAQSPSSPSGVHNTTITTWIH